MHRRGSEHWFANDHGEITARGKTGDGYRDLLEKEGQQSAEQAKCNADNQCKKLGLMRKNVWDSLNTGDKAGDRDKEPEKPAPSQQKKQTYYEESQRVMKV